jgi:hypothetical protein
MTDIMLNGGGFSFFGGKPEKRLEKFKKEEDEARCHRCTQK